MEKENQSLQKTGSKEQENYKSVFLKKRSVCNRQSVYISGEIQKRITQIVGVITGKQVSIGSFIDNILEEHLNKHNDVLSVLYREEMQKGIFNQPKENKE
ncbi:DUF3408 domain-containing protein [Bacteroides fragilis]|nr:DUF3408 domain-containing protein [Bacteroides fragilis]